MYHGFQVICAQIFLPLRLFFFINFHQNTKYGKLIQKINQLKIISSLEVQFLDLYLINKAWLVCRYQGQFLKITNAQQSVFYDIHFVIYKSVNMLQNVISL